MYDSFFRKLDHHTKMVKKRHAKEQKQHLKADPYYYKKQHLAAVNREKLRRCIKANAYSSHPSKKKKAACEKKYGPQVAASLGRTPNNNPSTRGKHLAEYNKGLLKLYKL